MLTTLYQILREEKDLKQCNLSFHDSDYTLPNNKKRKKTSREKWSNLLFNKADFTLPKRKKGKSKFEGRNGLAYFSPTGCRMGAEAVLALMDATADSEPVVVSLVGNKTVR